MVVVFAACTASAATTRIVSGIVGGGGGIVSGSGFKVKVIPAGSGGSVFTNDADVQNGSNILQPGNATGLVSGEWLEISTSENGSFFFQITGINGNQVSLNYQWQGESCACATVVTGMTLWNGVTVTFDKSFSSIPSVTFGQEAITPSHSTKGMYPGIVIPQLDPAAFNGLGVSKTGFQIYEPGLPYSSYNGLVPAGPNNAGGITWSFVAVGQ